jgi:protein involved in polysaccharide export with SLBB domain
VQQSFLCLAVLVATLAGPTWADDTQIAPSDVLTLRVTDWRTVDGELREWTAITGSYVVGVNGSVVIPHIGEIAVAGQSPGAVGDTISAALKQQFALADLPDANVAIESRRPVLVGGAVQRPGEVPYMPEMTVRHAVALAGGILSPTDGNDSVIVQSLTAEAQLRILGDQAAAAALRIARLRAELEGRAELAPEDMPTADDATVAVLRADATQLLALNRDRLQRELELIDSRIALLGEEIVALEAKQDALNRQKVLADEQRANTEALTERGLAVNARLLDAERTLVTVETQVLDVATALLQARQTLDETRAERIQLVEGRSADLMLELQTAEIELAELRERLMLQRAVVDLLSASLGGETATSVLSVTVYRGGGDNAEVIRDGLDTPLRPGDLVEVTAAAMALQNGN